MQIYTRLHISRFLNSTHPAAGANPVTLTFAGSVVADDAMIVENVLAVLCQRLQPEWNSSATPPYCATAVESGIGSAAEVPCPSECTEDEWSVSNVVSYL